MGNEIIQFTKSILFFATQDKAYQEQLMNELLPEETPNNKINIWTAFAQYYRRIGESDTAIISS